MKKMFCILLCLFVTGCSGGGGNSSGNGGNAGYYISIKNLEASPQTIDADVNSGEFYISWDVDYNVPYDTYDLEFYIVDSEERKDEIWIYSHSCPEEKCGDKVDLLCKYDPKNQKIFFDYNMNNEIEENGNDYEEYFNLTDTAYIIVIPSYVNEDHDITEGSEYIYEIDFESHNYEIESNKTWGGGISISSKSCIQDLWGYTDIQGGLSISDIHDFNDLTGLSGIVSVGGTLRISYNSTLKSLKGLKNLKHVDKLIIKENPLLEDLQGLESLETVNAITIENNENLCASEIQYFLNNVGYLPLDENIIIKGNCE